MTVSAFKTGLAATGDMQGPSFRLMRSGVLIEFASVPQIIYKILKTRFARRRHVASTVAKADGGLLAR
ncbi:hypothetical protein [Roseicyclus mahoneyensis]|uniref:Uncharacterized protein n=1 Tax=Roseicyclus mahoneyensis TaxID=164332 RepID=A0A316GF31_9RHOB|nr:hypothetical protein [Roseicyclus mahoneyensis]PWK59203.1 hypothetical protein C7455_109126 [Roseicyclus mahoneyensis]